MPALSPGGHTGRGPNSPGCCLLLQPNILGATAAQLLTVPRCLQYTQPSTLLMAGPGLTQPALITYLVWFSLSGAPELSFSDSSTPSEVSSSTDIVSKCGSCCPYSSGPVETQGTDDVAPTAVTLPSTCWLCPP